ncbi:MAG: hypothetical protein R8L07_10465 [Alphaproteobacteria bacterium]|nr:hypothetical protein [Alphaproteobacteria bacterium]
MKGQPTPSDMLEELVDKALSQMDRLAVTSFRSALDELIDFHRFLIDAYETRDETGAAMSFAQIGYWSSLHAEWIQEYRRLFERAAQFIGRENDFIVHLVHVPNRLLPQDARHRAPEVIVKLLDLVNILVLQLERWVTERRDYHISRYSEEKLLHRGVISDEKAYKDVLENLVGSWESVGQNVSLMYKWRTKDVPESDIWEGYSLSWPFLNRHMKNTAYLLAVAVWNEDEVGVDYFCETLLRWFGSFEYKFDTEHLLITTLLTPEILDLEWGDALDRLGPLSRYQYLPPPTPSGVFSEILRNALADTITVASGVFLGWYLERKQESDIAVRTVHRLLNRSVDDEDDFREPRELGFRPFFHQVFRIYASGPRFKNSGYGNWLDELVASLDSMTERRVIPGRVYTPSTRSERTDLMLPWLSCMLGQLATHGDSDTVNSITEVTAREELFPDGDLSLRNVLYDLKQFSSALRSTRLEYLGRGALALNPDLRLEEASNRLQYIVDEISQSIDAQRRERLKSRAVSIAKIEAVRERVHQALTMKLSGIDLFSDYEISMVPGKYIEREHSIGGIEKGLLTEPPMADGPSNIWEFTSEAMAEYACRCVWGSFSRLSRQIIEIESELEFLKVMDSAAQSMLSVGKRPILLVRDWDDPHWMQTWFSRRDDLPSRISIERKTSISSGYYMGTVNEVDVYRFSFDSGRALLFSSDLLARVIYAPRDGGLAVDVEFVDGIQAEAGKLVFRFSQDCKWLPGEVVELRYSAS